MLITKWFNESSYASPKEVMRVLESLILGHNYSYYVLDDPSIPDVEFDKLWSRLEALEAEHPQWADPKSPTQKVSGTIAEGSVEVRHSKPMLSIGKALEVQDVKDFEARGQKALNQKVCKKKRLSNQMDK